MRIRLSSLFTVAASLLLTPALSVAANFEITFANPSFDATSVQAYQLNGNAQLSGSALRITEDQGNQAGSVFNKTKVNLINDRSFSAYFTFRFTNPGSSNIFSFPPGADGMVFAIQTQSNTAGGGGAGIGYGGIPNSLGVEFDTYDNGIGAGDPDDNHIGINLDGDVNSVAAISVSSINGAWNLKDGAVYHAWIDYDGATDTLEVRLNRNSDLRPVTADLSYSVDLAAHFGPDVYAGFTSGTGGAWENHDLLSSYFNNQLLAGGIDVANNSYTSAPNQVSANGTPASLAYNSGQASTISATVLDVDNTPAVGQTVYFSTSAGTLSAPTAVTNGSGVATILLTAAASPGSASVRAAVDGGAYGDTSVTFVNVAPEITEGTGISVTVGRNAASNTVATLHATDANQETITWTVSSPATHGTALVSGTGSTKAVQYQPADDFIGSDTFTIAAADPALLSDTITVTVTVSELDSDGDGVADDVEVAQGTNPNDRGSSLRSYSTTICSSWNSFWYGHLNIFEYANRTATPLPLRSTLHDFFGQEVDLYDFLLEGYAQFDLLLDFFDHPLDSYGLACGSHSGAANAYEGRIVHYKLADGTTLLAPDFEFAFPLEGTSGQRGNQTVLFNNYHPSMEPTGGSLYRANWVILSNIETTAQTGTMRFYGANGTEVASVAVSIEGRGERHFGTHSLGLDIVGQAVWEPSDSSKHASLRSIRYYYDNVEGNPGFQSAAAIDGGVGSGEELVAPIDGTTGAEILEVGNTLSVPVGIEVTGASADGTGFSTLQVTLGAHETRHFILDSHFPPSQRGQIRVRGDRPESVVAYMMHYARSATGAVSQAYGTRAVQAVGNNLRSSFNTYLGQGCELLLANATGGALSATVTVRAQGGGQIAQETLPLAAHGSARFDICSLSPDDQYGTAIVSTPDAGAVVGVVVRVGAHEQYRFATPLVPSAS